MRAQYSDFAQCTHVSGPDDREIRSPDDRGKRDVWGFVSEFRRNIRSFFNVGLDLFLRYHGATSVDQWTASHAMHAIGNDA